MTTYQVQLGADWVAPVVSEVGTTIYARFQKNWPVVHDALGLLYAAADLPVPEPITYGMVRDILTLQDKLTFEVRQGYDKRRIELAKQYRLTPEQFEEEALLLFQAHGFTGHLTSLSGDEGIDLDLREKGRTAVAQLKRYRKPIGQPALRDFAGAMRASGAEVGYFITTSEFTDPAIQWAASLGSPRIVLVDGRDLVAWARDGVMPR